MEETVGLTDIFLLQKIVECGIQFVGRQLDAAQVCYGVGLPIVENLEDLLHGMVEPDFRHDAFRTVAQTDIALMAVMTVLFAEVAKQLTATAYLIVGGVANHGMDALTELFLPFFIDGRWQLDMLHILAPLGIADIRRLFLGNEM